MRKSSHATSSCRIGSNLRYHPPLARSLRADKGAHRGRNTPLSHRPRTASSAHHHTDGLPAKRGARPYTLAQVRRLAVCCAARGTAARRLFAGGNFFTPLFLATKSPHHPGTAP